MNKTPEQAVECLSGPDVFATNGNDVKIQLGKIGQINHTAQTCFRRRDKTNASKPGKTPVNNAEANDAGAEAETAKLNTMKTTQIKKLAASLGASNDDLEDALDSDDPKAAFIELVLKLRRSAEQAERTKLESMKNREIV